MNELEVATQRIMANQESDIVTISVAPNFLVRWLMPRMKRFQKRHPDVELQISAATGLVDFNKTNADMAIYFGHGEWRDIEVHFLRKVFLVPVCSPKLLDSEHPLKTPRDLKKHNLIHVSRRLNEWRDWLRLANVKLSRLDKGFQFSSSQLATAAAQEGLGVALADNTLSSREIAQGELIMPFDIQLDTHKSYYLVYQKGKPVTHGMQVFKDWVDEEMRA